MSKVVIDQMGPLPIEKEYTPEADVPVLIMISG